MADVIATVADGIATGSMYLVVFFFNFNVFNVISMYLVVFIF